MEEIAKSIIFLTSEQASKITGHVMKVDGGKTLTMSGFIPWYGAEVMNRRFEPDFLSNLNYFLKMDKNKANKAESKFDKGSDDWITEI